jgi:hypothetical protein
LDDFLLLRAGSDKSGPRSIRSGAIETMVWTRTRAYPNIPADARLGGKYRWDIEILPDARSPKTSTRLGEP